MLVIRYFRIGKKNQPSFKIVVTDQRMPIRGGRFVEEVGFSDPIKKKKILNAERIKYWIAKGAQPSASIHNLLISQKIIEGKKIDVHNKKKLTEAEKKAAAATAATPAAKATEVPKVPAEAPKVEAPAEEKKIEPPVEEKKIESPAT
ncbi:30S ribosomal protein S16 [Candidatus Woesebacteria bacterium RBG_16_39_8b]|uniref:Small ribosomal subunit protein bS16 n=1 Tax=Candidatus Woesebacteria bacterium RBG_16_39_8b TaxID=1802482 RepID=A0A1F7XB85_9BACT|nr:MAG: 30S ribosomal protein S16 [Candidatus Woesebacteria bacterium RBG_16_39_8b]